MSDITPAEKKVLDAGGPQIRNTIYDQQYAIDKKLQDDFLEALRQYGAEQRAAALNAINAPLQQANPGLRSCVCHACESLRAALAEERTQAEGE